MNPDPNAAPRVPTERVLGIEFFSGTAAEAVEHLARHGGYAVIPAGPALMKLNYDEDYRRAMQSADLALADSGLLALMWRIATGRKLRNISGITFLKQLLGSAEIRTDGATLFVFASGEAKEKAAKWFRARETLVHERSYHVASSPPEVHDYALLSRIEELRPRHVVMAIPGGTQEKLALYLREHLVYRPSIYCVGAALGFLSGSERPIPEWAEKSHLGWAARLFAQPRMFFPRLAMSLGLARMVFKYRSELPPVRSHWADA
ncbi:MAG: glycosyltransferase [Chthoniobacterales bacterium]|nr:MAG: glycosyltransferase [Chthoniobacterales bacterium]